jgi:hypothetical protein
MHGQEQISRYERLGQEDRARIHSASAQLAVVGVYPET